MNEEIEYAEMLEIPVSTVNVVPKKNKNRRKAATQSGAENAAQDRQNGNLKDSLIARVNGKVSPENESVDEPKEPVLPYEGLTNYDAGDPFADASEDTEEISDRIDTVRLLSARKKKRALFSAKTDENSDDVYGDENEATVYETKGKKRTTEILLKTEFALVCALSATIFLTNVFMPTSAINRFFSGMTKKTEAVDDRTYSDFTLSNVVSALSDTEIELSEAGVLSFTDECMVYPAVDGTVTDVLQAEDGSYTVKISHSKTFTGVMEGLNQVYYAIGDTVKANVPIGFTNGERAVQVTMYSSGELLNCFEMTDDNCLAWLQKE